MNWVLISPVSLHMEQRMLQLDIKIVGSWNLGCESTVNPGEIPKGNSPDPFALIRCLVHHDYRVCLGILHKPAWCLLLCFQVQPSFSGSRDTKNQNQMGKPQTSNQPLPQETETKQLYFSWKGQISPIPLDTYRYFIQGWTVFLWLYLTAGNNFVWLWWKSFNTDFPW